MQKILKEFLNIQRSNQDEVKLNRILTQIHKFLNRESNYGTNQEILESSKMCPFHVIKVRIRLKTHGIFF